MHIPSIFKAGNFAILFLALFVFNGVSSSQVPEDEPISVKTDLIQTNITVTDKKNRFVDGLTKDQFELRLDGKTVPIDFFERKTPNRALFTTIERRLRPVYIR